MNGISVVEDEEDSEEIKLSDVKKLKKSYWIVALTCAAAMTVYIPFLDNINRLFQKRFCFSESSAGRAIALVYIITPISTVPLGLLVDKYGKRRVLSVVGMVVFLVAQLYILLYPQCTGEQQSGAIAGLVLEGIGYCFYCNVLIGCISLVTRSKNIGTALGLMEVMESIFEFAVPEIASNSVPT